MVLKVTQIKYIRFKESTPLYSNLNFDFMGKKGKTLLGFVNKLFSSADNFSWSCFASCLIGAKYLNFFKIAVWRSDSMKRNYVNFFRLILSRKQNEWSPNCYQMKSTVNASIWSGDKGRWKWLLWRPIKQTNCLANSVQDIWRLLKAREKNCRQS